MKVFASSYLEKFSSDKVSNEKDWKWSPEGGEKAKEIYASGANTSSNQSTYAAEKDDRSDSDRPNEGLFVA
jgi:hypothetical protein